MMLSGAWGLVAVRIRVCSFFFSASVRSNWSAGFWSSTVPWALKGSSMPLGRETSFFGYEWTKIYETRHHNLNQIFSDLRLTCPS